MDKNIDKVISILNNIKGYEKISKENSNIKRLGGMTNIVHLVETDNIKKRLTYDSIIKQHD